MRYIVLKDKDNKTTDDDVLKFINDVNIIATLDITESDTFTLEECITEIAVSMNIDVNELKIIKVIDNETEECVKRVVEYLYKDEEKDYEECQEEISPSFHHIFEDIDDICKYFRFRP